MLRCRSHVRKLRCGILMELLWRMPWNKAAEMPTLQGGNTASIAEVNFNRPDCAYGGCELGNPGELNECNFSGASRKVMPALCLHDARHPGR